MLLTQRRAQGNTCVNVLERPMPSGAAEAEGDERQVRGGRHIFHDKNRR
jgi:hypothetical protein